MRFAPAMICRIFTFSGILSWLWKFDPKHFPFGGKIPSTLGQEVTVTDPEDANVYVRHQFAMQCGKAGMAPCKGLGSAEYTRNDRIDTPSAQSGSSCKVKIDSVPSAQTSGKLSGSITCTLPKLKEQVNPAKSQNKPASLFGDDSIEVVVAEKNAYEFRADFSCGAGTTGLDGINTKAQAQQLPSVGEESKQEQIQESGERTW